MKIKPFNTPRIQAFGLAAVVSALFALLISLAAVFNPDLDAATYKQSLLLVSSFSSLALSFFIERKEGNWWLKFKAECFNALAITVLNLLVGMLCMFFFSKIPLASQSVFYTALNKHDSYFLLSAAFFIYPFFRLFLLSWRYLDHLRRHYFTWSLTYYFLVIVVCLAFAFLLIVTLSFSFSGMPPLKYFPGSDLILDWLVFNVMPVFGIFVGLLFISLLILVPPFALFSYFFAKKLTGRLKNLGDAASALRRGDYKARCPVKGQDEIAQLQADFNMMADNLEQTIGDLNREKSTVNELLKERKELVASVSHELKTPITTITNYLEVTRERVKTKRDAHLAANVAAISQEIERMNLIVNDLFDLSRAEIGRLTIGSEECILAEIIQQVIAAQKPLAWQNRHVELVSQVEAHLPAIRSDRNRLVQILSNLVRNGIQHTPPGGIVQVRASKQPNKVMLTVVDTGEGIHPDDLPHIWTRFYKGRDSGSGNGIGLSVVKELTELMGGEVSVKSEAGAGSQFQVALPIHPKKKTKLPSQA